VVVLGHGVVSLAVFFKRRHPAVTGVTGHARPPSPCAARATRRSKRMLLARNGVRVREPGTHDRAGTAVPQPAVGRGIGPNPDRGPSH
jgi:hypothetical protein